MQLCEIGRLCRICTSKLSFSSDALNIQLIFSIHLNTIINGNIQNHRICKLNIP